jgi:hypothetical protein
MIFLQSELTRQPIGEAAFSGNWTESIGLILQRLGNDSLGMAPKNRSLGLPLIASDVLSGFYGLH